VRILLAVAAGFALVLSGLFLTGLAGSTSGAVGTSVSPTPHTALIDADSITTNDGITDGSGNPISLEEYAAEHLGYSVTVVSGSTWDEMTSAQFAAYQLLIVGDPICSETSPTAIANASTWAPVVMGTSGVNPHTGNRVVVGTDPEFHYVYGAGGAQPTSPGVPTSAGAEHLVQAGEDYAGGVPGATGIYFDTSCTDPTFGAPGPGGVLSVLNQLTTQSPSGWTESNSVPCGGSVSFIASNPAFTGVTDTDIQGWECSDHVTFPTFPTDWNALAVATDTATTPTCGTDPHTGSTACGQAYVLVAGSGLVVTSPDISLTPATNSSPAGGTHTVTATVTLSGSPVTGQAVSFAVSGTNTGVLGTCVPSSCVTNSSGQVTFTYPDTNGIGSDTIDASTESGGITEHATAQQTWTSVVTKGSDTTVLHFGSAPTYEPQSPIAPGTGVSLQATVNPGGVVNPGPKVPAPTGSVTFYDGSVAIAKVTPNGYLGSAYAADLTSKLAVGSHEITAVYSGDSNYPASTSNQVQISVTAGVKGTATDTPTTVGLDFGSGPSYTEQSPVPALNPEVFAVTVSTNWVVKPGAKVVAPTGTVTLYDGTTVIGTTTLTGSLGSGFGSVATTKLPPGSNEITAVYSGDGTHPTSTSNQVQVTVS
jgi:hypothetical protein